MTEGRVEGYCRLARELGVDEEEFLELVESSEELAGWIVGRSPRPEDTFAVLRRRVPGLRDMEIDIEMFATGEVEA